MRELLLAYLFGQLDMHERDQVERALAEKPQLREELRRLQDCLEAKEQGDGASCEPPADLVKRTCERIARLVQNEERELAASDPTASARSNSAMPERLSEVAPPSSSSSPSSRSRCSLGELAAAIGVTFVMATLIIPAIYDSRVLARRNECQVHLREIARSIDAYAAAHHGAIPFVPAVGPDSFAGIFPVLLADGEFIDRQRLGRLLVCPGTIRVGEWQQDAYLLRLLVPTHRQVMAAPDERLAFWRRRLAESFAYRFGYIDAVGRYSEWRIDFSPRSAILSDAPILSRRGFQSANHGGHGQNVAFADGHVNFIVNCPEPALQCGDHLFLNKAGVRAAPFDPVDIVLGRSEDGPGVQIPQDLRGLRD